MPLETLPPDCKTEDILSALEHGGGCSVADWLAPEDLEQVETETAPWIELLRVTLCSACLKRSTRRPLA